MEDEEESPQLKGFVIISLPPSDNPSLGKTITAFAISAQSSSLHSSQNQEAHQAPQGPRATQQRHLPLQQLPSGPQAQFSLRRFLFGNPRSSFGLVSVFIFALIFWAYASPQTLSQSGNLDDNRLRDDDDDEEDKPGSFIFDLYSKFPKLGAREMLQKDIEVNLGKFEDNIVSPLDDAGVRVSKIKRAVPTVDSTTTLPVKGNIYPDGLYYTYILVGSPPRPYFLDIDTGSDLAWVQCDAPCTSCAKGAHPFYKPKKANIIPSKDSLCAEVQKSQRTGYCETCPQCDYEIVYADQSSSMGVLTRDELHLSAANGSLAKSKVIFGCAYDQQGSVLNSLTKTDGILGLSRAKVSLPSQLASQGLINNVIGHCLTADGGGGGYMFFGDEFVLNRKMEWVPMLNLPSTNSYVAEASSISYGNKQLSLDGVDNGHIIFDSGSSYTYFTKQAYSDLVARLQSVSANGFIQDTSDNTLPICWRAKFPIRSIQNVKQFFKPLTFQFGRKWFVVSMNMRIPPEGYLVVNSKGNVCLGILDGSEVQDGSTIILGDVSLRGQLIVYDNVKHRIGWMQSDCVKPRRKNS